MAELPGIKFDKDKLDWSLMPWAQLEETVDVLMFGAARYAPDNWKKVELERYQKALLRHVVAYSSGEKIDPDSGFSHLSHVICNCLFALYHENKLKVE